MDQPGITGKLNRDVLKEQGVTDPFNDPRLLNIAAERNTIASGRANVLNSAGIPSSYDDFAPWTAYTQNTIPTNPPRNSALDYNGPMQDDSNGVIPTLTNPFTDTGAPITSTAAPTFNFEDSGYPVENQIDYAALLAAQQAQDAAAAQAAQEAQYYAPAVGAIGSQTLADFAPLGSDESYNYGAKRGGKVSKHVIAALLRR
jgi:hypothetical protein